MTKRQMTRRQIKERLADQGLSQEDAHFGGELLAWLQDYHLLYFDRQIVDDIVGQMAKLSQLTPPQAAFFGAVSGLLMVQHAKPGFIDELGALAEQVRHSDRDQTIALLRREQDRIAVAKEHPEMMVQ